MAHAHDSISDILTCAECSAFIARNVTTAVDLDRFHASGLVTEDEFRTEEGRILMAEAAAGRVARLDRKRGHEHEWTTETASTHLAAAGFTPLGSVMYSQQFADAYRRAYVEGAE